MSEGPYRNMSYEDAANAMQRIYEALYPRKFHSYNTALEEPFADYVGTRSENDPDLTEYKELYGKIGKVVNKYAPILGDESYSLSDTVTPIPANKSKVILDLHGMAILNSLLQIAELGARYLKVITSQISEITNNLRGATPEVIGNNIANGYITLLTSVDSDYKTKYGEETFNRVKSLVDKLSSSSRTGVVAKNVNVVKSVSDDQIGQEDVISDAFDKDFIEYFIMYINAENEMHNKTKAEYDSTLTTLRSNVILEYKATTMTQSPLTTKIANAKIMRFVDVSGCRESCVGLCIGSCSNTCFGCTDKCSGQCTNTCGDCTKGCRADCVDTCQGGCTNACTGCTGDCMAGCKNACKDSCATECVAICYEACVGSCLGTAEGFTDKCAECGSACKGTCGNSCETESNGTPVGPDPKPPVIEIPDDKPDPDPSVGDDTIHHGGKIHKINDGYVLEGQERYFYTDESGAGFRLDRNGVLTALSYDSSIDITGLESEFSIGSQNYQSGKLDFFENKFKKS